MESSQSQPHQQLKQTEILDKYGLKQESQPAKNIDKKLFKPLWQKKSKLRRYGDDKKKVYEEKLAKVEAMTTMCREKGWFEPKDWKENNVDWVTPLKELFIASEEYAAINIKLMTLDQKSKR
jgi:hypothetical protein